MTDRYTLQVCVFQIIQIFDISVLSMVMMRLKFKTCWFLDKILISLTTKDCLTKYLSVLECKASDFMSHHKPGVKITDGCWQKSIEDLF